MTAIREIPFGRPWIDDTDRAAVDRVLHGHVLTHGPECKAFEAEFAGFMGAGAHAVSMSSCMAALHMAYVNFGIGPGNEVIVPAQTHVATVHAVELVGARPVFVDCDPTTGNVTADRIAAAITPRTKGIGLVHFCGVPCEMPAIMELAKKHDLRVVEDCAIAIGTRIGDTHVGLFGDVGTFSFYPVKHITTGEGGMLVSNDATTVAKVGKKRAFGVDRSQAAKLLPGAYDVDDVGLNYRMSEMSAALGRTQIHKLPEILRRRAANFATLHGRLESIQDVRVLHGGRPNTTDSHYCLVVVLEGALAGKREKIVRTINERGVGTSVYYPQPVPRMKFYREKYGYEAGRYPSAEAISDHGFALPVGPHLTEEDMRYVGDTFAAVVEEARK
jgi:dTDP-4-amino-4,6-dideoxygalactose transaminase